MTNSNKNLYNLITQFTLVFWDSILEGGSALYELEQLIDREFKGYAVVAYYILGSFFPGATIASRILFASKNMEDCTVDHVINKLHSFDVGNYAYEFNGSGIEFYTFKDRSTLQIKNRGSVERVTLVLDAVYTEIDGMVGRGYQQLCESFSGRFYDRGFLVEYNDHYVFCQGASSRIGGVDTFCFALDDTILVDAIIA